MASKSIKNGDLTSIVKVFYELGRQAEIMHHPDVDRQLKKLITLQKERKRKEPLLVRNAAKKYLKERAKTIATEKWDKDSYKQYRISTMSKQVRSILEREINN